jgi:tetrahydromethanopterin S-methyltransferase subunit G
VERLSNELLIAVFSLIGTCAGSLGGILATNKLVNFRLDKLEAKVEKHNNVIERTYKCESRLDAIEKSIEKQEV